jgi:phosphoglycolate phosphatase
MAERIALFDLDGTLLDTSPGILHAVDEAARSLGLAPIGAEDRRSMIGPPIEQSFRRVCSLSAEEADRAAAVFRRSYAETYLLEAEPYPGIYEVLEKLRLLGWRTGVATYKRDSYARKLMKAKGITDRCDFCLGSVEGQTKQEIIRRCIEALGGDPEHTVMVGDTVHDAEGAKQAGCAFIGVTFGFGFRSKEEILAPGALAAADTAEELLAVFAGLG